MAKIAGKAKRYPSDLTEEEWERIKPLLPKTRDVAANRVSICAKRERQELGVRLRQPGSRPVERFHPGFGAPLRLGYDQQRTGR